MKKLSSILNNFNNFEIFGVPDIIISGIQYDSRKIKQGNIFAALKGATVDGHNFIDSAIRLGASAILCENTNNIEENKQITFVKVPDSRAALALIAHNFYDNPSENMNIIGITGTNGKTSISFLLRDILETAGISTGIIGTTGIYYNDKFIPVDNTTPESLEIASRLAEMKEAGVKAVALEVSSHALAMHRVDCIKFSSALFTNLTHEHLDYHKTMEEYAKAKKILFDNLPETAIALLFNNSEFSEYLVKDCKAERKYFIGRSGNPDILIINEKLDFDQSSFEMLFGDSIQKPPLNPLLNKEGKNKIENPLLSKEGIEGWFHSMTIRTNLLGGFNIENAAMAASIAYLMEIDSSSIYKGLLTAKAAPGRMQTIKLKNGAIGIVDYAHSPDALEKALRTCRIILETSNKTGSIICIFGCGGDRDKTKRPEMGRIASELADFVILTDDNPRTEASGEILNQIYNGIEKKYLYKIEIKTNRSDAIARAIELSKESDIILVAGKGHENYQVIGLQKYHFDDVEELNKFV